MSSFKLPVRAINPKREDLISPTVEALVDTGSELTWLPEELLTTIGITPRREKLFQTAIGQRLRRSIGYAIIACDNFETNDEIVFAQPGDMTLLGVRTLEGFGVLADPIAHRLVASTTIAA